MTDREIQSIGPVIPVLESPRTPKFVSPSRIARYYFHECERLLRYSSTPKEARIVEGVPKPPFDTRPVTRAILDSGFAWEEEVLRAHLQDRALVAAGESTRVSERVHTVEETKRLLMGLRPGQHVYQGTLATPPTFYERYGLDTSVVRMSDCRPDLVECYEAEGAPRLRVVDIKASPGLKLSHRIQATLYTLILEHLLDQWEVRDRRVSDEGGIWLDGASEAQAFDIRAMRPPLETFLEHELQPLLELPADQARWHLYFRCEWCEYFDHCRQETLVTDNVSRLPYLSSHAKRYLGELQPPVVRMPDLDALLTDAERAPALDDCASLRGEQKRLLSQVTAMETGEVIPLGGASLAMPKAENVRLVLTLQREPVSGKVYAYAILAQGLRDVLGDNPTPMVGVAPTGGAADVAELERTLVRDLHGLLLAVDRYNADREGEWKAQKSLQAFTFDSYERDLLTEVLLRRLVDPVVAEVAMDVFFHFQRPELVRADDHPANEVFFPVVVLTAVLRQQVALPVDVAYRFADVVRLLRPSQYPFDYTPKDYYSFELSNQLRSDAIFSVWTEGKAERVAGIATELNARVRATNALINGLREELAPSGALFAWPPKFRLPTRQRFQSATLSRLAFIARYESIVGYLDVRQRRMATTEERLSDGAAIRIRHAGGSRWTVDERHHDLDIPESDFPNWLIVEDAEAGQQAMLAYDDYANRDRIWVPRNSPVALAAIRTVEGTVEHPNRAVDLKVTWSSQLPGPREGITHLLQPRFTDFSLDRVVTELRALDAETSSRFLRIVEDPVGAARAVDVPEAVKASALELAKFHGMTPSQLQAFERVLTTDLQLVWGPPGTGKTHFLALAVLALAEAHRAAGLPFRVLLTAFTHTAIDNCLRKLVELDRACGIVRGGLPAGRLKRTELAEAGIGEVVDEQGSGGWLASHPVCVLGGTVWSIRKDVPVGGADMLVVDEGSQLRVPESAIAIRRLRDGGRLVVAGDDRQLPPIVLGTYPAPEEGAPLLHRSIFECLRQRDVGERLTATLLENFRMNRVLCSYPAEQVYVPEYTSADDDIGQRRLALGGPTQGDLVDLILDPEYPLVVGVLSGVRATAENRVEAALVSATATRLRERLISLGGSLYPHTRDGDTAFWKQGLFVVSPHHAQINAIHRALGHAREWRSRPFVDTVDKMQGQECDAVITSYGVSDVEYAMNEKEFIYSLNRLNVAITRARAKSIVFLPQPLIEPPIQAFEDDETAVGVAFMQGLVQFAERHGVVSEHGLADGAVLRLLRVSDTSKHPVNGDSGA